MRLIFHLSRVSLYNYSIYDMIAGTGGALEMVAAILINVDGQSVAGQFASDCPW